MYLLETKLFEAYAGAFGRNVVSILNGKIGEINQSLDNRGTNLAVESFEYDSTTHTLRTTFYEIGTPSAFGPSVAPLVLILVAVILAILVIGVYVFFKGWNAKNLATNETIAQGIATKADIQNSVLEWCSEHPDECGTSEELADLLDTVNESYDLTEKTSITEYIGWATLIVGGGIGAYFLITAIQKKRKK